MCKEHLLEDIMEELDLTHADIAKCLDVKLTDSHSMKTRGKKLSEDDMLKIYTYFSLKCGAIKHYFRRNYFDKTRKIWGYK